MKPFLLCIIIGLTLLIGKTTHAQDSLPTPKPSADSLLPADSTSPAVPVKVSPKDSLHKVRLSDSLQQDRLKAETDTQKTAQQHSTPAVDSARPNQDSSKIVDIFEEMAKAQHQQDQSIKNEASQQQLEKKEVEQAAEKKRTEEAEAEQKAKEAIAGAKAAAQNSGRSDTTALEGADAQSLAQGQKEPISQDSTIQAGDSPLPKKDSIQSIFTLPAPEPPTGHDTTSPDASTLSSASPRQQSPASAPPVKEATSSAIAATENQQKQKATKKAVKDSLNPLFDSTSAAAGPDSSQTRPPTVQPAEMRTDTSVPSATTDTSSRFAFIQDSLQAKNTPFTELFKPYRTFDKQTSITSTTSLTILQQHVDYKTSADFTTAYQRTAERAGDFLFDVSVVKLNTEVETMGVQLKYNSNEQTDSTSTFAKPLFDIVGKRTFIQVDSTGKITAVDTTQLGRQVNTVLSGLSLSGGDFEIGSNFGLLASRSGINQAGQSWTDSVTINGNKRVTTYKVQSIVDGDMLVTISGTVSQTGEINSDGALFKTHFSGTQKGKMYVDLETLLVKSRDITLNMSGTVDYNGQSLPAAAVSKIKENVSPN